MLGDRAGLPAVLAEMREVAPVHERRPAFGREARLHFIDREPGIEADALAFGRRDARTLRGSRYC